MLSRCPSARARVQARTLASAAGDFEEIEGETAGGRYSCNGGASHVLSLPTTTASSTCSRETLSLYDQSPPLPTRQSRQHSPHPYSDNPLHPHSHPHSHQGDPHQEYRQQGRSPCSQLSHSQHSLAVRWGDSCALQHDQASELASTVQRLEARVAELTAQLGEVTEELTRAKRCDAFYREYYEKHAGRAGPVTGLQESNASASLRPASREDIAGKVRRMDVLRAHWWLTSDGGETPAVAEEDSDWDLRSDGDWAKSTESPSELLARIK